MGAFDVSQIFGNFGAAASDLFGASADQAKATAAESLASQAMTSSQADLLKSQGDLAEGAAYGEAAGLADLNAQYTAQSTAIQTAQADRQLFGVLGGQKADVAASGFREGGSAGDILRSSAQAGRAQPRGAGPAGSDDAEGGGVDLAKGHPGIAGREARRRRATRAKPRPIGQRRPGTRFLQPLRASPGWPASWARWRRSVTLPSPPAALPKTGTRRCLPLTHGALMSAEVSPFLDEIRSHPTFIAGRGG
jgi:hypothetical protein